MAALPVSEPGRARNFDLFVVDGNDFKIRANYKQVELAPRSFPSSRLQNYSGFQRVGRRDQPRPSLEDQIQKSLPLWLGQKNSDQR